MRMLARRQQGGCRAPSEGRKQIGQIVRFEASRNQLLVADDRGDHLADGAGVHQPRFLASEGSNFELGVGAEFEAPAGPATPRAPRQIDPPPSRPEEEPR